MWVAKIEYTRLVAERATALETAAQLSQRTQAQQAAIEWLMHLNNRLEHQISVLMATYMGVKMPVPELGKEAEHLDIDQVLRNPGELFADVGDDEAKRLGLDWDATGAVTQGNRK